MQDSPLDQPSNAPNRTDVDSAAESGRTVDSRDVAYSDNGSGFTCDLCGAAMLERHCKLICARCGYQRDCSDP